MHVGRGQAWSIDLVIGVLIFLLVIGLFYVLLMKNFNKDTTELQIASETIATKIIDDKTPAAGGVGIIKDERIDKNALEDLAGKDYETLKKEFGITSDFCIFLEDEDGNVINITNNSTKETFVGIGSSEINISGSPCGVGN